MLSWLCFLSQCFVARAQSLSRLGHVADGLAPTLPVQFPGRQAGYGRSLCTCHLNIWLKGQSDTILADNQILDEQLVAQQPLEPRLLY
jgi:hypothetical protein